MCQKLYVPNDACTQLFADANVHTYPAVYVYSVNMLMCVKRCMYLIIHVYSCFQMLLIYVYSCISEYIAVYVSI